MKEMQLTRGYVALVDDADFEWLSQWKWTAGVSGDGVVYAMRRSTVAEDRSRRRIAMHRAILDAPSTMVVDHANHDTLDNRRGNLRLCTSAQNNMNRRHNQANTSGHKGVHWNTRTGKWIAKIKVNRQEIWLGRHERLEDAVEAYRKASIQYHGEFGLSD